jgi:D-threonate/D-erythronate kinase
VVLLPDAMLAPRAAVTVLDTESRDLEPTAARAAARAAAARLVAGRPRVLYKKLDSTLRGPVAAELHGMLEGSGLTRVLVAPAFPAQGRTVVDGIVRVGGRPADETAIAGDVTFPRTGASALAVFGAGGPHPVASIPLDTVRQGQAAVRSRLSRFEGAFLADAETATDLDGLAPAGDGTGVLVAGSAGLAAALARRLVPDRRIPDGPVEVPRLPGPLLVVAGSAHPVTLAQLARLRARGLDDRRVLSPERAGGVDDLAGRAETARRLGALARERVERAPRPGTVLLTGGESAAAVCRALGATGLRLDGEVEPGLARGRLLDGPRAGLAVVTKAGGFGDPDTLVRLWEACR